MNTVKYLLAAFITLYAFTETAAQCKSYTKKVCLPELKPYKHNGKLNNTILSPGDKAEMSLTFFSGQNYRLFVCSQDIIGTATYKVMDADRNVIFESAKNPDKKYFEFKVASTQQLIVEITIPNKKSLTGIIPEGCVSILVGYKD
jgi:hypothetical protein